MATLIRLIIIIALAYLVWRLVKATLTRTGTSAPPATRDGNGGERMLPCAQCGIHVPESEAFRKGELVFCSQDHQKQYLDDPHG